MRKFSIVALVLVFALCATAVMAQTGAPRQRADRPGQAGERQMGMGCPAGILVLPRAQMVERGAEALQLTADQKTKLGEILTQHDQVIRPLIQKQGEASTALRNALVAPQYDAQNVQSLAAAAQRAEADIVNARINGWTAIRGVLTADQVTKLRELMTQPRPGGDRPAGQRQGGQRQGGPGAPPPP